MLNILLCLLVIHSVVFGVILGIHIAEWKHKEDWR